MPLHDLVGLREPDAAAAFFRREVKLEDFLLGFPGDSAARVLDLDDDRSLFAPRADGQLPALAHGLHTVDDHVENGLLHEVEVDFDGQGQVRQVADDGYGMLISVRRSQGCDLVQHAAQVDFFQLQITRACEVDEDLYDTIQPVNLAADDVHMPARARVHLL